MNTTKAQRDVLILLDEMSLTSQEMCIYRVQERTLLNLRDLGFAKPCPYAKPFPCWKITAEGRKIVDKINKDAVTKIIA